MKKRKQSSAVTVNRHKREDERASNASGKLKRVERRQNGAQRFNACHEEQYEARYKRSGNLIEQVNNHNKCYPKLNEELMKRKSITQVTTINPNQISKDYDLNCSACAKLILFEELKRMNLSPKCNHSGECKKPSNPKLSKSDMKPGSKNSLITKRKSLKFTLSPSKISKYLVNDELNHRNVQVETDKDEVNMTKDKQNGSENLIRLEKQNKQDKQCASMWKKKVKKNTVPSQSTVHTNRISSRPSMSSYCSFTSNGHEPMDM